MRRIVLVLLVCMMAFSFVGCSNKKESTGKYDSDTLNVLNWGEYIGEDVINNFERTFHVKVNYSMYDSCEMLYTKLLSDDCYDVIVPADYMIDRLIREDMLQPIDTSYMTNDKYLTAKSKELLNVIDDGCVYSVPYFVSTAGIVYDKRKVSVKDLEAEGWGILKDMKYAGDVFIYDSERDSFMMALKDLGYSANTTNMDEIIEAYQWLVELNQTMEPSYVTDEVIDAMVNDQKALAVVYSGDAAYITSVNEHMGYFIPDSGSRIEIDAFAIPKTSKNAKLASEFINFMLDYDSALDNSLTVGYTSTDSRIVDELTGSGGEYEGNNAYLFDLENPNSELFIDLPTIREALADLWIRVKTQK